MENQPNSIPEGGKNVDGKSRVGLSRLIFLVFLIVVLGVFWYSTKNKSGEQLVSESQPTNNQEVAYKAQVAWVDGVVEYKSNGEWKRAVSNTELSVGDSVEVMGEGRAIIALDDGSAIRLDKNSTVTLTDLNPENIVITNDKGSVYTRIVKADREFAVKIEGVSYVAMGTAFKTVNKSEAEGVEVYQSKVKILGATDKELLVEEGNSYYLVNKTFKNVEKKITKMDAQVLTKDEFIAWNTSEDQKIEEFKDELGIFAEKTTETDKTVTKPAVQTGSGDIVLTGKKTADGVYLSWTLNDIEAPLGFKVVKSTSPNPVYPGNNYVYLSLPNERNYTWDITDGKTYYFRVCRYLGEKCGEYSNNVIVTAPKLSAGQDETSVTSITLSGQGTSVNWAVEGSSEQGFKLVWSKNHAPTYPCREGDQYVYYSSSEQKSGKVSAFDGEGKYYVRVCEYLGGACGVYSNEIEVTL